MGSVWLKKGIFLLVKVMSLMVGVIKIIEYYLENEGVVKVYLKKIDYLGCHEFVHVII